MTRDEFDALVKRLEAESKERPRFFLATTIALVLGAYAYLLTLLFVSLAFCVAFIGLILYSPNVATIKFGIIVICIFGGLLWAIIRGLWVRLEPPKGLRITPQEAPALFEMLDQLRASLKCQPFHEVLLVGDHNAAVVQIPRLGIFGWHKNYLLLGLPLMEGLEPEEFKAVLAHEFAHSSRGHGRFGNWLYRLRQSWHRVVEEIARQGNKGMQFLTLFLKFFWPRFSARSFVLSRANEYEADNCAVRLTSPEFAARALMRIALNDRLLSEKFWPGFFQLANTESIAPGDVYKRLSSSLRSGTGARDENRWLRQAFLAETNSGDTHPSLKDRLAAIGFEGNRERVPLLRATAGEAYLGGRLPEFATRLSEEWQRAVEPLWKSRHEDAAKTASELAALEETSEDNADPETLWKRAHAIIDLKGDDAAMPLVEEILRLDPAHCNAMFIRGRRLLAEDDPQGEELIEKVIARDALATESGLQLIYAFCARTGRKDRLRPLEDRLEQFQELKNKALQERNDVTLIDTFLPHGLTDKQLGKLHGVLAGEPKIGSAAVVRKQCEIFPEQPSFVIALRTRRSILKMQTSEAGSAMVNRIVEEAELPGYIVAFVAEGELKPLGAKVFACEGAVVYTRAG